MDTTTLAVVIALGTAAVLVVSIGGFVMFSRFLKKEEENSKKFRAIHRGEDSEG